MHYQPMPASKSNSLLHDTLKAHKDRLRPVVACDDDLGVPGKDRELLIPALLPVRRQNPGRTHLRLLQHFDGIPKGHKF